MNVDALIGSDSNESQATQILQELLEIRTESSRKLSETHGSALKINSGHANEISSDSLPTTRHLSNNSHPQYHFQGFAATQSQSQNPEDHEELNEGSQKENIGASRSTTNENGRVNAIVTSRPASPTHASSSKDSPGKGSHMETRSNTNGTANKRATSVTATSFQSPKTKLPSSSATTSKPITIMSPHKPSTSRYHPTRRRPSPAGSDDSFAGDDPYRPDELAQAKAEKLNIPLSQLGQQSSPVREESNNTTTTTTTHISTSVYSRGSRVPVNLSPPTGKVLVEATPTNSTDNSQEDQQDEPRNLSQQLEATQLVDEPMPPNQMANQAHKGEKDGNTDSDESPSSSFRNFLGGARESGQQLEATQPSTQVDDSSNDLYRPDDEEIPTSNIRSMPQPQSLISMVSKDAQYRYRNIQATRQAQTPTNPSYQTGQVSYQETQPSTQPSEGYAAGNPRRTFPPPNASASRNTPTRPRQRAVSPTTLDNMDFVPDSEPPAEQSPRKMAISPAKPPRRVSPPEVEREGSVVEDSDVEMEPPKKVQGKGKGKAVARAEEEEEEDDEEESMEVEEQEVYETEEEIPLVVAQKSKGQSKKQPSTAKGKTPAKEATGKAKATTLAQTKAATKAVAKAGPSKSTRSWGSNEVPSSLPEQDHPQEKENQAERILRSTKAALKPPATKAKPAPKPASAKPPKATAPAAASSSVKPRAKRDREPSSDEETENGNDTEVAEDEDEDVKPPKKRKVLAAPTGRATRGASKRAKTSATPAPRQTAKQRLRSAGQSTRSTNVKPTRVFALWKQDCHFYPGTVHSMSSDNMYTVKFDDGTDGRVSLDQMRLGDLRVGDDVLIPHRNRVSSVTSIENIGRGKVEVNIDDVEQEIDLASIRIASKTIQYDWQDRVLTEEMINPTIKPVRPHLSPSPSRASMISLGSVRSNRAKVLAGTGLIITLTSTNTAREREKEKVMNAVKNSGGIVIDDLNKIIKMEGKHSHANHAWIIKQDDVQWIGDADIQRLFLIADEPNQKPKFLIALALGIPCLETNWLYESVAKKDEKPWLNYLMPQGFSDRLVARPSQQVDMDWGNSIHHITHIMSNAVPCKLFDKKDILCVGPDTVPKPKKKNGGDEQDHLNALPRVILAMGATTVEAVTELKYASKEEVADYAYVVIREPTHYSSDFAPYTTVHWAWVKECLIASRLLPLPEWPSVEYSQEA